MCGTHKESDPKQSRSRSCLVDVDDGKRLLPVLLLLLQRWAAADDAGSRELGVLEVEIADMSRARGGAGGGCDSGS